MTDTIVSRENPWDEDAELATLAACVLSKNARIAARRVVRAEDFYRPVHELLFRVMADLDHDGAEGVDWHTLLAAATRRDEPKPMLDAARHTIVHRLSTLMQTVVPSNARTYATHVHDAAVRRRLQDAAVAIGQQAWDLSVPVEQVTARAVTELHGVRDSDESEHAALTLDELLQLPADSRPWVIPHLMRSKDRLMLTGTEGVGKSNLSRQLGIMAAAGVHPFDLSVMPAARVLYLDAENSAEQFAEETRPLMRWIRDNCPNSSNPGKSVLVRNTNRINLHSARDVDRIHSLIDDFNPALVVMGPIYKMTPGALNTDDDASRFLSTLETITERGCALILEAHAGHAKDGVGRHEQRALRPRGSSALLGWPEFGFGLRATGDGMAELERWRGDRSQRAWPARLQRAAGKRWVEAYPGPSRDVGPADVPPPDDQGPLLD